MAVNKNLRELGKSGIKITSVGLGCWQFSKQGNMAGKFWPVLDDKIIDSVVSLSLEGGINWFDTAEIYGNGASEKALSLSLVNAGVNPGDVVTATKWWPAMRFASNISKTFEARIKLLEPFPVDLYQVHQPFGFSSVEKEMEAMAGLYDKKLIRAVGVSNFNASRMKRAFEELKKSGIPLASNQVRYSLLDRSIESNGVMQMAKDLGITIIAYSPLAQGILSGKFHDNPDLLRNIGLRKYSSHFKPSGLERSKPLVVLLRKLASKYNVTPSQIALNWLINYHGDTVVVIPGATKESHIKENIGAMSFRLTDEDMAMLDKKSEVFK